MISSKLKSLLSIISLLIFQQAYSQNFQSFLTLNAPKRMLYDRLGFNCELGENMVVLGAPEGDVLDKDGTQIFDAGYICVYERLSRGDWKETVKISSPDLQEVGHFGQGIALHNNNLLVGEPLFNYKDSVLLQQSGRAWFYYKDDFGNWRTSKPVQAIKPVANAWFGFAVALTDSNAFISAPLVNHDKLGVEGAGGVYVFNKTDSGYCESQFLTSPLATTGQQFGNALAADENTLVVAAYRSDLAGIKKLSNTGAVYIYERSPLNQWILKQELRIPTPNGNENFGNAISLCKDYLVVAACQDALDDKNLHHRENAGAAYVYHRSKISKKWELEQKIVSPQRSAGELFGFSVSLDNQKLAISSPLSASPRKGTIKEESYSGTVFMFSKGNTAKWALSQTILPVNTGANFGSSVKLRRNWLIIGAYREEVDENGNNAKIDAGAGYLMEN